MSTDAEVMAAVNERLRTLSNLVGATLPSRPESLARKLERLERLTAAVRRVVVDRGARERPSGDHREEPTPSVDPEAPSTSFRASPERLDPESARSASPSAARAREKAEPERGDAEATSRVRAEAKAEAEDAARRATLLAEMTAKKARVERELESARRAEATRARPEASTEAEETAAEERRSRGREAESLAATKTAPAETTKTARAETTRARAEAVARAAAKERAAAKDAREAAILRERPRARLGSARAPERVPSTLASASRAGTPGVTRRGITPGAVARREAVITAAREALDRASTHAHRRPSTAAPASSTAPPPPRTDDTPPPRWIRDVVAGGSHSPEVPAESFRASRLDAREAFRERRVDAARRVVAAEGAAERRAGRTSARAIQSARGSSREPSAGFPGSGATPARPPATRAALPRGSRLARPLADDPPPASRRDDEARSRSNARVRPASARAREAYFSAAAAAMRWPGEELDAFDAALDATRWRPPRATSARKPLGGRPSFALERVASVSDRIAPRLTNASTSTSMAPRSALERLPDDVLATILARLDWRSLAAAEESSPEIRRVVVERRAWGACVARSVAVARAATAGGAFGDAAGGGTGDAVRRFAADRASVRVSALLKQFARKLAREPRPRARGSRSFPPNLAVEALCASSTDRDPEESVDRVLAPRSRGGSRKPPSYWSSAGSTTRDATDHVVLRLNAPLAVVHAVWIAPFRAYFQRGKPTFAPARIRVHVGLSPNNRPDGADDGDGGGCSGPRRPRRPFSGGFTPGGYSDPPGAAAHDWRTGESLGTWLWSSPEFEVAPSETPQRFPLPTPALCVGGIVAVELAGRHARQASDGLWYVALAHVRVEGVSLPGYVPATVTTARGTRRLAVRAAAPVAFDALSRGPYTGGVGGGPTRRRNVHARGGVGWAAAARALEEESEGSDESWASDEDEDEDGTTGNAAWTVGD